MRIFFKSQFWYNKSVKGRKSALLICLLLSFFFLNSQSLANEQAVDNVISQLQRSFEAKDIPSYLTVFSPEIREREESLVFTYWDLWKMDTATFYKTHQGALNEEDPSFFLQVLYQNSFSAMLEIWRLELKMVGDQWQIQKKEVTEIISNLYKIKIPSEKVERVSSIEIEYADIKLAFNDALLFYDNIPDIEIALLVLGDGHLFYSPSSPVEKHQLELIYKKDVLEDRLEYAYLRFSNSSFQNNIRIEKKPGGENPPVSKLDRKKAASLFAAYYPRSFTIENSLTGELLSYLPQGEQAVFDFRGQNFGDLTYIYSPFVEEEINFISRNPDRIINLYSPQKEGDARMFITSFGQNFKVNNYELEVDFKPEKSYLSAKAKIEIAPQVDALKSIKFNFNPELDILRIYDQEGHELFFTKDNLRKMLYVYFLHSLPKDKNFSIEIFYRGVLKPAFPTMDVLPGAQSSEMTFTMAMAPRQMESYLFSQSTYWYPANPDQDYFQARLKVIIPPEYTCIATGELAEQGQLDEISRVVSLEKIGSSFYVFETKYPVKYLSFIVGKFNKVQEVSGPLLRQLFVSIDTRGSKRWLFEESFQILQFYEGLFGSFPFEKLAVIVRTWNTGGGHSPASFIVLNELPQKLENGIFLDPESPVNLSRWKEYFIAHEIAHQWWGQAVTWREYHDLWLSEGLSQFSTVLYLKKKYGDRAFGNIIKKFSKLTERQAKWGSITLGSRLSYLNFEAFQTLIYNKTSVVLNMLHDILGEETFFNGLKNFFNTYRFHPARTRNFIKIMEKNSGRDLSVFFKGWLDLYTLPEVSVTHDLQKLEGEYLLRFNIRQMREIFAFPLWLKWRENGREVKHKILVSQKNEEFKFQLKEKPAKIKINPDKTVPGKFF